MFRGKDCWLAVLPKYDVTPREGPACSISCRISEPLVPANDKLTAATGAKCGPRLLAGGGFKGPRGEDVFEQIVITEQLGSRMLSLSSQDVFS